MIAWMHGQWASALLYNPFTLAYPALLVISALHLVRAPGGKALHLPTWLERSWILILALSWMAKFILGPAYW